MCTSTTFSHATTISSHLMSLPLRAHVTVSLLPVTGHRLGSCRCLFSSQGDQGARRSRSGLSRRLLRMIDHSPWSPISLLGYLNPAKPPYPASCGRFPARGRVASMDLGDPPAYGATHPCELGSRLGRPCRAFGRGTNAEPSFRLDCLASDPGRSLVKIQEMDEELVSFIRQCGDPSNCRIGFPLRTL